MDTNYDKLEQVDISREMRTSFLDYSMSVIVQRALPDVRDGMKPVHRRILHSMNTLGITASVAHKKSARIVGEVIGKYHPHGDTAVYDAMVRMAQDFSYRYPLVDGHGNFGSMDGDGAAAMRYTEARMSKISMEMMKDIQKDTVDFEDNYDGEEKEPVVLPARFPNLLVNGSVGIAVGMATNIPPHNLGETIDATLAIMDDPDITVSDLMENYIPGPDFPTGGIILGRSGIRQAYETGRGSIIIRSKVKIEEMDNGKKRIIVYEIPYQVNKATMIEKIASLVREKVIDGITYLNDESNRDGVRIVIELRKDVQEYVILNQLYRLTPLQTSFGINMLSLVNGAPKQMGIKETLQHYVDHQVEVTTRRTRFDLKKAEDVAKKFGLKAVQLDVRDHDRLIEVIKGADIVLNCVQYNWNIDIMKACLEVKAHYIDLGGLFHVTKKQLELDEEFKAAGLTAVLGMGSTPGTMNVMAGYAASKLDTIEEAKAICACGDFTRTNAIIGIPYSLLTVMEEHTLEPWILKDGVLQPVPAGSGREIIDFTEPIGPAEAFYCIHSEPVQFASSFKEKGIKNASFKLSLSEDFEERISFLAGLGFATEDSVSV